MVFSIIFLLLNVFFLGLIFFLVIAFFTGAPYVPTTKHVAETMIKFANISRGSKIYDLGSGDGRLLYMAAQKGANAVGYEINPFLVLFTKLRYMFSPVGNKITVHWRSFWGAKLTDADVVFIYLIPWRMEKLDKLLRSQLKPGTLIVSNSFIFPKMKIVNKDLDHHVYAFKIQ